jgi:DNA modification methylase
MASERSQQHQLAIVQQRVSGLKPNPQNARVHSTKQVRHIAESIRAFGFNVPILVDRNLTIIAGHARLEACRLLGIEQVPTIALEHLSENQVRAFLIADNRLAEIATWDEKLLAEQLKALSEVELDFELEAIGFETAEIDVILEGLAPTADGEQDDADVLPADSEIQVTGKGDLWLLDRHRVYCGDALLEGSYGLLMDGALGAMAITDPPYNVRIGDVTGLGRVQHREFSMASGEMTAPEFIAFLATSFRNMVRHTVSGSIHDIFMDWRHMEEILAAGNRAYSELINLCVWAKDNAGMGSFYRSQHELVFVFKNGNGKRRNNIQLGQFGRYRSNLWSYAGMNSFARTTDEGNLLALHPTVKPVALVADAIMDVTRRGDVVLDPFLGSGTSVVAAERVGRVCYGMEIDAKYVDTIVRRWEAFTGHVAVHSGSGRSFRELEEERQR